MESNSKSTRKKINFNIFFKRVLFCFLFIYLLLILISQQFKFARLKEENALVDTKIEEAQKERKNLDAELESIDNEDYLRRIIREKLGYTRPNEKVFIDASK